MPHKAVFTGDVKVKYAYLLPLGRWPHKAHERGLQLEAHDTTVGQAICKSFRPARPGCSLFSVDSFRHKAQDDMLCEGLVCLS